MIVLKFRILAVINKILYIYIYMNYEQKYIKYKTKYISLRNKQDGGIHSYIWKYSGKDNRRDFSAENQILIQKGINSGARLILIEHIVAAGPDTGKRIMYSIRPGYDQIEELKINPDQTYTIFPTKLRYIYDAAVVVPVIPAIELQNEYYTADLGTFSYDPVNEQNMINYMIINNLESNRSNSLYCRSSTRLSDSGIKKVY